MGVGTCAICGKWRELTVEHLPPKSAFNNYLLLAIEIDTPVSQASGELSWRPSHATTGRHLKKLCARCNGRTGSWYATDYRDYVKVAAESRIPPDHRGQLCFTGRPAAVAKEALAVLCTSAGKTLAERHKELRRLILSNKYRSSLPDFRLWTYLTAGHGGHQTGATFEARVDTGKVRVVAEFSHWPVGWVLSWHDTDIPELYEVTHWLDMEYKSIRSVTASVPRVWTVTGFPLDYRTPAEVERDTRCNLGLA